MARQNPIKYVFNVSKPFKEVRHYKSETKITVPNLLTTDLNISKDRRYNNSQNVSYWLKIREKQKWSKVITGLKATNKSLLYYGDIPTQQSNRNIPTHLLVFKFNRGGSQLIIYLYQNYYPSNIQKLQSILSNHY